MWSTTRSGRPLAGMGSHCHAAPSARLSVSLCSGLALDCSSGTSKRHEARSLHVPHAAAEQGLSDFQIQQQKCLSQALFYSLHSASDAAVGSSNFFLSCFFLLHGSSPSFAIFAGKGGLPQQQGEEGVQLWFELLCLEAIVAG